MNCKCICRFRHSVLAILHDRHDFAMTCLTPYTTIIGLEVHVQLATASKLFCGCSTQFGGRPNTQTCPVCIGMPGTLPVMNREAFELALKTAVALELRDPAVHQVGPQAVLLSRPAQGLSDQPVRSAAVAATAAWRSAIPKGRFEPKRVGIIRAHLEEDAGKSMHDEVAGKADSRIDLNRTGTPLLEIVSQPDLRSPAEAKAYLDRAASCC